MSAIFSENVGADEIVAFGPASASIESSFSMSGPQGFDVAFGFLRRLFYEPAKGNLLMDVRLFQGGDGTIPPFDAVNIGGDSISRVYGGIEAQSGLRDSSGLITKFYVIPVPEPTAIALFLCGATFLGWRYQWKHTH